MDTSTQRSRRGDADTLRRFVLAILTMGIVGTGAELVLLEHMEDFWQWVPLVLFVAALPCAGWLFVAPGVVSVRVFSDFDGAVRRFGLCRSVASLRGKCRV